MYKYSIKTLLKVKRWFDHNPDGIINIPGMFPPIQLDKEQWHKWLSDCINAKINRNDNRNYRKLNFDYQCELMRAARMLNTPRLIIDWLPKDLKERFDYRLRCNMDLN